MTCLRPDWEECPYREYEKDWDINCRSVPCMKQVEHLLDMINRSLSKPATKKPT